jgi:hypothetical protein
VQVGDMVADQLIEVVLRVTFPYGDLGRETGLIVGLAGQPSVSERLSWTWADDPSNDRQPRDITVDQAVARQFAASARQEAVSRNRAGDYIHARRAVEATASRIRKYAGRDPEMRALVSELETEAQQFAAPMAPAMLKEAHFAAAGSARSRDASGRSLRRRS